MLVFRHVSKIMFRGLQIVSPHSCNVQMLIISWPWALFECWLLIIWRMSVSENPQKVKVCYLSNFNLDGNVLLFGMREHWLAKKELKISLFSLKLVTYLLLWKIGGMHGTFFSFSISSIVKWGYQGNFKSVCLFFYEKISRAQKAPKRKTSDFHPLRSLCVRKIVAFVV